MKLHQNMEKMHSGSWTKALGKLEAEGDAPVPVFTLHACTKLPHHILHKSSVGGNAWGTIRAQRTFCSLAAPCASPPNVLSYLASSELNIFMSAASFYWVFVVIPFTTGNFLCLHNLSLVAVTRHFPRLQMILLSAARAQNMQPLGKWWSLSWPMVKNEAGSSTVLTAQLQEKFHCVNNTSTCISLRTWQNSDLSLQHWAHQAALLSAHQSHLSPLRLQIKSFFPSYISIISILMKLSTSFTSLAFAPCKKNKERRAGGFFSTAKGSSNPAAFSEVAEVAYKWLNWTRFLPQCTANIVSKAEDKKFWGNKVQV